MTVFAALCERLDAAWAAHLRAEDVFPELARRALEEARLCEHYDLATLVDQVIGTRALPPQNDPSERFGQPPITIARGEGFALDLLFWVDGLVTVHEHGFSGAFQVFSGSSIHTQYRFTERDRATDSLLFGHLELASAELLVRGDIREILQGPSLIHATFHVDRPTVTIVLRTIGRPDGPQYDYRWPSLALDPAYQQTTLRKRLQMLRMLHRVDLAAYWRSVASVLEERELLTAYVVLDQGYDLLDNAVARARLFGLAREQHGEVLDALAAVLEASANRRLLVRWRATQTDQEVRFLLALLLTVPIRSAILALVTARYPDEPPADVIVRSLEQLSFNQDARLLAGLLLRATCTSMDRGMLRRELGRAGVRVDSDYELLRAVQVLRETPGFAALFAF